MWVGKIFYKPSQKKTLFLNYKKSNMPSLIEIIKNFNSKERFFLAGQILGNPAFSLSREFREKLGDKLGISIPAYAFSAMDYHLDWLYAAMNLARDNDPGKIYSNAEQLIKAQQEDVDWLTAFEDAGITHLILIEAKGVSGWTNKQMTSKANRLREIFGEEGDRWSGVVPHFVVMSPKKTKGLETKKWPQWMVSNGDVGWIPLEVPEGLTRVVRCDGQGCDNKEGGFWKVEER